MATGPREWPNNAKDARDQAAEKINNAKIRLDTLLDGRVHNEHEVILVVAKSQSEMSDALRWLERVGAKTTPKIL